MFFPSDSWRQYDRDIVGHDVCMPPLIWYVSLVHNSDQRRILTCFKNLDSAFCTYLLAPKLCCHLAPPWQNDLQTGSSVVAAVTNPHKPPSIELERGLQRAQDCHHHAIFLQDLRYSIMRPFLPVRGSWWAKGCCCCWVSLQSCG